MLPIDFREIGDTGLSVSEVGYGTSSLGNLYKEVSDVDAHASLATAWKVGMRYFDTAPFYGFGLSERRVGDFVRAHEPGSFVLSTKVGRLLEPAAAHRGSAERHGFYSPMPFEPVYDYSYDGVMRSYEASLQRLGLAHIDIVYVHDIGELAHGEDNQRHFTALADGGYRALDELRSAGDVKAIGLGVNEQEACLAAMQIGRFDCFLLAGCCSLLEHRGIDAFTAKCAAHGASLIIGGVYNSGILATGTKNGGSVYYNYAPAPPDILARVARIEDVCEAHRVSLPAAALQFPLTQSQVAGVVVGLGAAERVRRTIELYKEKIPSAFWADLKAAKLISEEATVPC